METNRDIPPRRTLPQISKRNLFAGLAGIAGGIILGEKIKPKVEALLGPKPPVKAPVIPTPFPAEPSPTAVPSPVVEPSPTPKTDVAEYFPEISYGAGHIKNIESQDFLQSIEKVSNPESLDPNYIRSLIEVLEKEEGTVKERIEAVIDNLFQISGPTGRGTALMIDESGIFLTAAHTMGALPKLFEPINRFFITYVTNPRSEKSLLIRQFMVMPNSDIALVYAPTGKVRKPVDNIKINTTTLKEDTKLWSYGIFIREEDRPRAYFLGFASGQVGTVQKDGEMAYDNLLQVDRMIPYGGLSGAPVVTREGRIIGTISGGLPYSEQRIPFIGAAVARVEDLNVLSQRADSALYTIPLSSTK